MDQNKYESDPFSPPTSHIRGYEENSPKIRRQGRFLVVPFGWRGVKGSHDGTGNIEEFEITIRAVPSQSFSLAFLILSLCLLGINLNLLSFGVLVVWIVFYFVSHFLELRGV